MRIDFRLSADVNGEKFDMNGSGFGDREAGTCTLNLEANPKFPVGFDPVSCPCICSHPTSLFFARVLADDADFAKLTQESFAVSPARRGVVCDASGKELLNLSVSGSVSLENGVLVSKHRMSGWSRLPKLVKTITPLTDYLLPSSNDEATAIVRFKLLAASGEILDGMTIIPYAWSTGESLRVPLARNVENIRVEWDGGSRVSAHYLTSIAPISEIMQEVGAFETAQS